MSRSRDFKITVCLAVLLLFALACDFSSLLPARGQAPSAGSPAAQFPTPSTLGTAAPFRPSAAGWIAFVDQNNVWLVHPDGSGLKQVTRYPLPSGAAAQASDFHLGWSPDGQSLAYSRAGVLSVLDISSLATSVRATATAGGFDWSPNAQQIIYDGALTTGGSGGPTNNGLWITDVASGQTGSAAASSKTIPAMIAPRWSYDTSRVIYSEPQGAQPGGMHLLNLLTDTTTDLMPGSSPDTSCSWSSRELLIACLDGSPAQGQPAAVTLLDGDGKQTRVIPLPAGHAHPSLGPWSIDATRLAVSYSPDASGSQVMTDILTLDPGVFKALGPGRASDWSSDGRWIVMESSSEAGGQPSQTLTVVNTTSGLSSDLASGSSAVWQPSSADTGVITAATQQAYCLSTAVGFVYRKPKGHFLEFCVGAKRFNYGALEEGVYAMGPRAVYFVYVSNSGYIYAARVGDPALTRIGDVREFYAMHVLGMDPSFQIRWITGYPNLIQIVELHFAQKQTFTLPARITAP